MDYIYETHLHTDESSHCGRTPAREYIPYYLDMGYRGIVVTDHFYGNVSYTPNRNDPWRKQVDDYCRGYEAALDEGIKRGLDVFFGIEQHFNGDEVLIYGVDKQWLYDNPDIIHWNRRQLFDQVCAVGGCIVHAHPFRVRDYISVIRLNSCVHAIEAFNGGNNPVDDCYALAYAKHWKLPVVAGTDMHRIGGRPDSLTYGVRFEKPWESIHDYVRAILNHEPFEVKINEGRGEGDLPELERPWEFRDSNDCIGSWSPEILRKPAR